MQRTFLRTTNHMQTDSVHDAGLQHPHLVHLIPGKLAFASLAAAEVKALQNSLEHHEITYISSALHRAYVPFASDFGPVDLGILHRFCIAFSKRLAKPNAPFIIYCFDRTFASRANACFLLAGFMMLHCGWSLEQASATFQCPHLPFPLKPFRDAMPTKQDFDLRLHDCLSGLSRALALRWYDRRTFSLAKYERLDSPCGGDIHEICPKFVAFKGPLSVGSPYLQPGEIALPPSEYVPVLRQLGVTCVVRLNEADTYDR